MIILSMGGGQLDIYQEYSASLVCRIQKLQNRTDSFFALFGHAFFFVIEVQRCSFFIGEDYFKLM